MRHLDLPDRGARPARALVVGAEAARADAEAPSARATAGDGERSLLQQDVEIASCTGTWPPGARDARHPRSRRSVQTRTSPAWREIQALNAEAALQDHAPTHRLVLHRIGSAAGSTLPARPA